MLYPNVEELRQEYLKSPLNQVLAQFDQLLKDYVGRSHCICFAEIQY
jgi:tryptophan synthase beta subunit